MEWNGEFGYEVSNIFDKNDKHVVNMKGLKCTCREWDLSGIPCVHAISVIFVARQYPENYISH